MTTDVSSDPFLKLNQLVEQVNQELVRLYEDAVLEFEDDIPIEIRQTLLQLGSSIHDWVIWSREVEGGWQATEVESGVSGPIRQSPTEAIRALDEESA